MEQSEAAETGEAVGASGQPGEQAETKMEVETEKPGEVKMEVDEEKENVKDTTPKVLMSGMENTQRKQLTRSNKVTSFGTGRFPSPCSI